VHLLIILALAIWLGLSLSRMNKRQSLTLIRSVSIIALVLIGLLALLVFIGYQVNAMFAIYLGLVLCAVGVVGGLVWLVVKLGKVTKA
jgi:hypothetical protein